MLARIYILIRNKLLAICAEGKEQWKIGSRRHFSLQTYKLRIKNPSQKT
jgi:hypothetical protein